MATLKKTISGHPQVLTKEAKQIILKIASLIPPHFYMAGGTCLALQLGHRISIDFDFFTKETFNENARLSLIQILEPIKSFELIENKNNTLHLNINHVSFSFFYYPYKLLVPLLLWQGIYIAQLEDIAPMKLNAILGRGSKKDFIDLFIISKKISLKKIFELSIKKFPKHPSFHLQAARALVFFKDAEREPMPKMLINIDWQEIKHYFEHETKKIIDTILH